MARPQVAAGRISSTAESPTHARNTGRTAGSSHPLA
jgi:hypothetical protein